MATYIPSLGDMGPMKPAPIVATIPQAVEPDTGSDTDTYAELDASRLVSTYTRTPRAVPLPNSAAVWQSGHCTDHMVLCRWTSRGGWSAPSLEPYGPLSLLPTASVLHYATECFEGMKLYRGHDGRLRLFRPDQNAARMCTSAARISLPTFPPAELQRLIAALAAVDGPRWLPKDRPGTYLYFRPTLVGTSPTLAVKRPDEALLFIVLCAFPPYDEPGGSLGPAPTPAVDDDDDDDDDDAAAAAAAVAMVSGDSKVRNPGIKLLASEASTVRAWPGGSGNAKVGANYGPSLLASSQAAVQGFDQILWLFGDEGRITEAGASNFFIAIRHPAAGRTQLITAPLEDQVILPGITRSSVLELARERMADQLDVVERHFTIAEVVRAAEEGRIVEAFAAGTVFFIAAVSEIHYAGSTIDIPLDEGTCMGWIAAQLRSWLRAIQYGAEQHPWGIVVDEM